MSVDEQFKGIQHTEPIHLVWRSGDGYERRVLCGLDAYSVGRAGAEWLGWRSDPRCCAGCLAIYTVRSMPVSRWDIMARLRRRQEVLRIRREARLSVGVGG